VLHRRRVGTVPGKAVRPQVSIETATAHMFRLFAIIIFTPAPICAKIASENVTALHIFNLSDKVFNHRDETVLYFELNLYKNCS
jgi:hypothetical protein